MPHLAAIARLRFAIKVEMGFAIFAQYLMGGERIVAHDIAHLDPVEARSGRAQRQSADRTNMVLELAACCPLDGPVP